MDELQEDEDAVEDREGRRRDLILLEAPAAPGRLAPQSSESCENAAGKKEGSSRRWCARGGSRLKGRRRRRGGE